MFKLKKFENFNIELEKYWKFIEKNSSCTPFQSLEWMKHYYKTIISNDSKIQLCVFVLEYNSVVTDILPLCIFNKKFVRTLEWLGGINTDYMGPISSTNSLFKLKQIDFKKIWFDIINSLPRVDLILLTKQPEYLGTEKNYLLQYFNKKKLTICHQAFLKNTWEEFKENYVKKKILNDNKRQKKRLSNMGKLIFYLPKTNEEKYRITKVMISQKHLRYLETGTSMFVNDKYCKLYLDCNYDLGFWGKIHISALKLNDHIIATHWGFYSKDTFYYIMPSFDTNEWRKYSPGKILLEKLMQWCCVNGVKNFDFTDGNALYKRNWSNNSCYLYDVKISNSFKGFFYLFFLRIIDLLKKITILKYSAIYFLKLIMKIKN